MPSSIILGWMPFLIASGMMFISLLGVLLAPLIWSSAVVLLCARMSESERAVRWPIFQRRIQILNVIFIPLWWTLIDEVMLYRAISEPLLHSYMLILALPPCIGIAIARFVTGRAYSRFFARRWTVVELLGIAASRTLSSAAPLLLFACAIEEISQRSLLCVPLLFLCAVMAIAGRSLLRNTEGFNPQRVKGGELFKRSSVLAQRMGVQLDRIFVYATGKGHQMNAHGGGGMIGMTDVTVHHLRGAQLDFAICHELAHNQRKHLQKGLIFKASAFLGIAALTVFVPHRSFASRAVFNFAVIFLPLLISYFISRYFEFEADSVAVKFTSDGESAIRALVNLNHYTRTPFNCSKLEELFLNHPSLARRIDGIAASTKIPTERMTMIRQQFNLDSADNTSL